MKKILIVEDDESFFKLCETSLKLKNYAVLHVAEGTSAVQKITSEMPDLVLLDIMLPGMSGMEILQALKAQDATKNIKTIMLTNFGTDVNVTKSMELGADDYIMKYNVTPAELGEKVSDLLGDSATSSVKFVE